MAYRGAVQVDLGKLLKSLLLPLPHEGKLICDSAARRLYGFDAFVVVSCTPCN